MEKTLRGCEILRAVELLAPLIDDTIYTKLKHYARKEKDLGTLPLDKCVNHH